MSFDPVLSASPVIHLHIVAALLAVGLLPFSLFRKRRDRVHKVSGYVWITAMLVTALSSFWINGIRLIGPFSPIHVLSVLTLFNVIWGLVEIKRGQYRAHERTMKLTAFWALGVAGLFTMLPGRLMNEALFGKAGVAGFATLFVIATFILARNGFPRGFCDMPTE